MSARRRNQAHDRLGRFTRRLTRRRGLSRAKLAGRLARAWRRALALTLAALRSELARRLGRLALVGGALAGVVVVLYQHGEAPAALARPAQVTATTPTTRAAGSAPAAPATTAGGAPGRSATAGAATAGGAPAVPGASGAPGASTAPGGSGAPGASARRAKAPRPADVATAWYAARRHLPSSKVQALQQDVVSEREVRVLVIADRGKGRLDTALVTVRRGAGGGWSVP